MNCDIQYERWGTKSQTHTYTHTCTHTCTHTHRHTHMLTHKPDLTDLFLCVQILRDGLCQISAVISVAVCQLLQCLTSTQKEKVKDLKEHKPHNHKQTQPAWCNVCVPCSCVRIVSWSLWPLTAGGTRPPPVSLSRGKERADVVNKTVLAFPLQASTGLQNQCKGMMCSRVSPQSTQNF